MLLRLAHLSIAHEYAAEIRSHLILGRARYPRSSSGPDIRMNRH